jgi:prolyl oligopeptidase
MLRFHKFTIGYAWCSDYGCSDKKEEFDTLIKYSPCHNINKDKQYPPLLLTTADHDDRVTPLHSYKYIAELQHTHPNNPQPLLVRIEVKAGHGSSMPLSKRIAETADVYAFICKALNIKAKF